jgi:hypothetical protein
MKTTPEHDERMAKMTWMLLMRRLQMRPMNLDLNCTATLSHQRIAS